MKKYLGRKYFGIPVAVLLIVALVGTAIAWYCFDNISSTTTVQEPLSVTNVDNFKATMDPGDTNTWSWDIVNSTDMEYQVKADLTYSAPTGVSIKSFIISSPPRISDETEDLTDDNSAEFTIPANGTIHCDLTITAAMDATPGNVEAAFDLSRG